MSTTIEQLELEITSSSTSAVSGIDALTSSLGRLKAATKGGVGLTAVARQITSLNAALAGVNAGSADNINKVTDALRSLTSLGKSNLNSYISQLQRLPQAVEGLKTVNLTGLGGQLRELASAFLPLSQMGKNQLTGFITQVRKIPSVMKELKEINMGELAQQMQELAAAFRPLATEMQSIANGFSAFPSRIQRLLQSNAKLTASNKSLTTSYTNLAAKMGIALLTMKRAAHVLAGWINKSNEYVEDMNLFTVALGEHAEKAKEYANIVSEVMGIDPAEWMRNQGIFQTLATGFGVASDRAYTMSQNLTQLAYDLSSFYNIAFDDAFLKLQSGLAGELEPLRRLGYDLSVARLQQEAYTLGIEKKVTAMTQAEKAELRYYAIMTQVTQAQGDMARTLEAPANQLRILRAQVEQAARSLGNLFIPILNKVLPYAIALAKVIRLIADTIARLFGVTLPEMDYSGLGAAAGSTDDIASGLENATDKAKEFKRALIGIDELNIIAPPEDENKGAGLGLGGGGLGFDLPTYDFIGDAVTKKIDEIVARMKEWLGLTDDIDTWAEFFDTRLGRILNTVAGIGAAFTAWKVAKSLLTFIDKLSALKGLGNGIIPLGLITFVADINEFIKYLEDLEKNGPTFQNVVGLLSEFAGMVGDALIMLGSLQFGGALKVVQGIGEIFAAIKDISENGINWENADNAVRGLTNIAMGIGVFTGNLELAGASVALQGFHSVLTEIAKNWDAIRQGDWSGIDKATMIIGGLEILGGLAVALDVFSKVKAVAGIGKSAEAVKKVTTATEGLSTAVGTGLAPSLLSLAKNLGLGLLVVAEVSAAALLIVGAIALLGKELDAVGKAWDPVLKNSDNVLKGLALGTAVLVAVGLATFGLGTVTVGTGGTIPLAIAAGTAVLVEIAVATVLLVESLSKVADEMSGRLAPALDELNGKLPDLTSNLDSFVGFMGDFAGAVVAFSISSVISGLSATVATIVGFFTRDPIKMLAENAKKVNEQARSLNSNLRPAINELRTAEGLLKDYQTCLSALESFTGTKVELATGMFVNMREVGQKMVTGFIDGIRSKSAEFGNSAKELVNGFTTNLTSATNSSKTPVTAWASNIKRWFTDSGYGGINRNTFKNYGEEITRGFDSGVSGSATTSKYTITTWGNNVKNWFGDNASYSAFYNIGRDVVSGFNAGINAFYDTSASYMRKWANDAISAFKKELDSHSPSRVFMRIGEDTVTGYNIGLSSLTDTTMGIVNRWAESFTGVSPVMSFAVDTSALKYYNSDSFAKSMSADVSTQSTVTATGFKDDMVEFYREFVEPMMTQMAADVRRQADKNEQTTVQIGNRVVSDAVSTQRRANGYVFAK